MNSIRKALIEPYILLVSIMGLITILYLGKYDFSFPAWYDLVFFLLVLFAASNYNFLLTNDNITISFNLPMLFIMTLSIGPFWATVLTTVAGISLRTSRSFIAKEFIFNRAMIIIMSGISSWSLASTSSNGLIPIMLDFFITGLIYCSVNILLLSTIIYLSSEKGLTNAHFVYLMELVRGVAISVALSFILYQVYINYGRVSLLVAFAVSVMLKNLLLTYFKQHDNFFQVIDSFMKVIDAKDHYTTGHCDRTSKYTEDLARAYGFSRYRIVKLVQVARLHDVGKIWIPENILNKPGKLTREEYEQVKCHSLKGAELISGITVFKNYLPVIRHHHERFDGTGYPDGLKGEEIPLEARFLALADAFDVMTHGRVYKSPMNKEQVVTELKRCSGTQFDPKIVSVLLRLLADGKYDYLFAEQEMVEEMQLQVHGE